MSRSKPNQAKTTTTNQGAERKAGRPRKNAATTAPKSEANTRVTVTEEPALKSGPIVPKTVHKLAATKAKLPRDHSAVKANKPNKKPVVSPHLLNEAYKEATDAVKQLSGELHTLKVRQNTVEAELGKTNRIVYNLRRVIDDLTSQQVKPSWLRRLTRRG